MGATGWRESRYHSSCHKRLSNLFHPDLELLVHELPFRIEPCVTKLRQKCSEISLVLFFELEVGQEVVVELHSQVARVVQPSKDPVSKLQSDGRMAFPGSRLLEIGLALVLREPPPLLRLANRNQDRECVLRGGELRQGNSVEDFAMLITGVVRVLCHPE